MPRRGALVGRLVLLALLAQSRASLFGVSNIKAAHLVRIDTATGALTTVGPLFGETFGYVANGLTAVDDARSALLAIAWSGALGHRLLSIDLATGAVTANWSLPFTDCDLTIGCGITLAFEPVARVALASGLLARTGTPALGSVAVDDATAAFTQLTDLAGFAPAAPGAALGALAPGSPPRALFYWSAGADGRGAIVMSVALAAPPIRRAFSTRARLVSFAWDAGSARGVGFGDDGGGGGFDLVGVDVDSGAAAARAPAGGLPAAITFDASISSALDARRGLLWWARANASGGVQLVATRASDGGEAAAAPLPCAAAAGNMECPWVWAWSAGV